MSNTPSAANTSAVSVGTSSTDVLPQRSDRYGLSLVNTSDTDISIATMGNIPVVGSGIVLKANGGAASWFGPDCVKGAIKAISSAGSKNLAIEEWTNL